jgi:uncharacterized protein YndB with AHSA1/START domain
MSPETQNLEFNQIIQASPAQIFYAFTNATALKEWLCDVATLAPRLAGRIYLAWNSGFYTAGEFIEYEPDQKLSFTWNGRNEPGPTQVEVTLTPQGNSTQVSLLHKGLGMDAAWANMVKETRQGWTESLENLASVLEKGPDLRIVQRPMLGITVGDFDKTQADHLGIPVSEGIRLDSVLDTMGAHAAGLRKDDVVVGVDGMAITDFASLASALNGRRGGDTVTVDFYRGPEKKTVLMELSKRPVPTIAASVAELAGMAQERFHKLQAQLDEVLEGVSEAEAEHNPAKGEWSVNDILAHLIHGERDGQKYVTEILGGQASWSDDYAGNLPTRTKATVSAFPTLKELRDELGRLYNESAALYECLPPELPQQRKGTWWGFCYFMAEPPYHEFEHFEQIRLAIQAARH